MKKEEERKVEFLKKPRQGYWWGDTVRGVGRMSRIYIKCIRRWAGEGAPSATARMCIGNFSWFSDPPPAPLTGHA